MTDDALALFAELQPYCPEAHFAEGARLREAGRHYRDMLLVTEGEVEVVLDLPGAEERPLRRGAGEPIGEMGFLSGADASATVTALTPLRARRIDDAVLQSIERADPALYVRLLRRLDTFIADRVDSDKALAATGEGGDALDIRLCRDEEMMLLAKRLRYQIHCVERGRDAAGADHQAGLIEDRLDAFSTTFLAFDGLEPVGTIRISFAWKGDLGARVHRFGMDAEPCFPRGIALCSQLIVRRSRWRGAAAMRLVAAAIRFGRSNGATSCYIECVAPLVHRYRAMGFTQAGPAFDDGGRGARYPMKLDTVRDSGPLSGALGSSTILYLYAKATLIRLLDGVRGVAGM